MNNYGSRHPPIFNVRSRTGYAPMNTYRYFFGPLALNFCHSSVRPSLSLQFSPRRSPLYKRRVCKEDVFAWNFVWSLQGRCMQFARRSPSFARKMQTVEGKKPSPACCGMVCVQGQLAEQGSGFSWSLCVRKGSGEST